MRKWSFKFFRRAGLSCIWKRPPLNGHISQSMKDDDITGYARTTVTLTRSGKPMFKYSEYAGMGHDPSPCYRDESLFPWMFSHTLAPR